MADDKVFDIFGSDIEEEEPRKRPVDEVHEDEAHDDDTPSRVSARIPRRKHDDSPLKSSTRITDDLDDDEFEDEDDSRRKKRRKSGGGDSSSSGKRKIRRRDDDEDVDPRRRRDDDDFIDDSQDRRAPDDDDDVIRTEGGLEIGKSIEDEEPPKKKLSAFDEALEKTKASRRSRGKELDRTKVESECITFLDRMMQARDMDAECYKKGRPALNKLRMLREVEQMLAKVTHREVLMENMLLPIIKAWMDPMQDGTLPNVQIRTSILKILATFRVDSDWVEKLRNSQGLGRVLHYYAKNEEHPPNKRLAEKIMMKWARPVYNATSSFHEMYSEYDRPDEGHRAPPDSMAAERRKAREATKNFKTQRERLESMRSKGEKQPDQVMAAIPRPTSFLYTALAEGNAKVDPKTLREHRQQASTSRKVNRTMNRMRSMNKNRRARAAKPSVNGRN